MADLFLGIDAGGTRTRVVLAQEDGSLLAHATGGPGNYQTIGDDALVDLCAGLVAEVKPEATPASLCAAVAGAGRAPEQAWLRSRLEARGLAQHVAVVSDARAALEGAHGGRPGIVVIAGTGSIVIGRNAVGEVARAGGWGPVLGDEGSAYGLVIAGVRAVLRSRDGWAPATQLEHELQSALELGDWDDVVPGVYGGPLSRERLAAACPAIFTAAGNGDRVASELLDEGAVCLGRQIAAVAAGLRLDAPVAIACNGGVFEQIDLLWPPLSAASARAGVELRRGPAHLPALYGALLLAAAAVGTRFGAETVAGWSGGTPEQSP